jgi:hypothetical protein
MEVSDKIDKIYAKMCNARFEKMKAEEEIFRSIQNRPKKSAIVAKEQMILEKVITRDPQRELREDILKCLNANKYHSINEVVTLLQETPVYAIETDKGLRVKVQEAIKDLDGSRSSQELVLQEVEKNKATGKYKMPKSDTPKGSPLTLEVMIPRLLDQNTLEVLDPQPLVSDPKVSNMRQVIVYICDQYSTPSRHFKVAELKELIAKIFPGLVVHSTTPEGVDLISYPFYGSLTSTLSELHLGNSNVPHPRFRAQCTIPKKTEYWMEPIPTM